MLLCIAVNVSLLLGPGQKTNKPETEWEQPEGESLETGQTRQLEEHRVDYVLSMLIIELNSHGCGCSHIDVQIHPQGWRREGEEEADSMQTKNSKQLSHGAASKKLLNLVATL